MTAPVLEQIEFRARGDRVGLNVDTWEHTLNGDFTQYVDTNFRVRFTIAETAGGMANNIAFALQYNINGGAFAFIGDNEAVRTSLTDLFTNGEPTEQLISTGTFIAGVGVEATTTTNISLQSNRTEIEWSLQLDSAQLSSGDIIQFRVTQADGTVLDAYNETPTITVAAINRVQLKEATQAKAVTFDANVASGNSIVVTCGVRQAEVIDVTDNQGNIYGKIVENVGNRFCYIWLASHVTGGPITVTMTTGDILQNCHITAIEYDAALDADQVNTGDSSATPNHPTGDVTTTVADTVLVAGSRAETAFSIASLSPGWNELTETAAAANRLLVQDKPLSATATENADWVSTSDEIVTSSIAAFKAEAAGADITVVPPSGAIEVVGVAPTIVAGADVTPAAQALEITGLTPTSTVSADHAAEPAQGDVAVTGFAPAVVTTGLGTIEIGAVEWLAQFEPSGDVFLDAATGTVEIVGFAPTVSVSASASVEPTTGEIETAAFAPTFTASIAVTPDTASLVTASFASVVTAEATVEPTTGEIELTGHVPAVEVTGAVTAQPGAGTLEITGLAPAIVTSVALVPDAGSIELTAFAPTMVADATVEPDAGSIEATGHAPAVETAANVTAEPTADELVITGLAPAVTASSAVSPDVGAIDATGHAPFVALGESRVAQPGTGSVELSAFAPDVAADVAVEPTAGELTITGVAATIVTSALVLPEAGAVEATGHTPFVALGESHVAQPSTGGVELTAFAPDVSADATVEPAAATIEITGEAPAFSASRAIAPTFGQLESVGFAPAVEVAGNVTADPAAGELTVTGQAPAVTADAAVEAQTGAIQVLGHAPSVVSGAGVSLTIGTSSLVVVGEVPTFAGHFAAAANDGVLVLGGFAPTISTEQQIEVPAGSIAVTGFPPIVVKIPPPDRRIVPVGARDRQFAVTGRRRVFRVGPRGGSSAA